jgi:large subunit ribosomal protein L24
MNKLRKGDQVVVLSGKDRGRRGTISGILDGDKVLVDGLNLVKRHQRGNPQKPDKPAGIIERAMPLHISNVAIWNPGSSKGDRVGVKTLNDGRRVRFLKSNGEVLDVK